MSAADGDRGDMFVTTRTRSTWCRHSFMPSLSVPGDFTTMCRFYHLTANRSAMHCDL